MHQNNINVNSQKAIKQRSKSKKKKGNNGIKHNWVNDIWDVTKSHKKGRNNKVKHRRQF